jgi:TonB-linked SusC/RagA family outer membrane protein
MNRKHAPLICLLIVGCFLFGPAWSQSRQAEGVIYNQQDSLPLPGISVFIKGTNTGTSTGSDGRFRITLLNPDAVLVISSVGFEQKEIQAGGQAIITVYLSPLSSRLDDIVVTGYSSQRKKDITGAVTVVDIASLKAQPAASATEALQGRAPGVTIVNDGSPGSTPQIRIRGYSTINNNEPLYVIDGVPFQGNISWLNQQDIQNIQVLKDASAASIYGARANNGVIIITTRKGREGSLRMNFDAFYGITSPNRGTFPEFMTPAEYARYRYDSYINAGMDPGASLGAMYGPGNNPVLPEYLIAGAAVGVGVTPADADPARYNSNPASFYQITRANHAGTDWMRAITQNGAIQNYQLGGNGGSKNAVYAFSLGYLDQKGTVKHTGFKRYNVRTNMQLNALNNHFRVGGNIQFTRTEGVGFATNSSTAGDYQNEYSPIGNVYKIQPIIPVYDIAGGFAGARGATLGDAKNPLAILYRAKDNYRRENRSFGNIFAEIDLIKGLTARSSFGANLFNYNAQQIRYPAMEDAVSISTNGYNATQGFGVEWTWTNTLTYKKRINDEHDFTVLAGTEAIKNNFRVLTGGRDGYFILGDQDYYYLNTGTANITNGESGSRSSLASIFARLDYGFRDKYLLSATIRRDGSSNFGAANRYGVFPSVSAAWRVSGESFMESVDWVSDLKLRLSYGETGNQSIPANNAYDLFQIVNTQTYYPITGGNVLQSGVGQNQIGNPNLKWEAVKSTNLGIDFTLFRGKLDGSVDLYRKITSDMLYSIPLLQQAAGMANSPFQNIGSMKNQGVEIMLNYHHKSKAGKRPFSFDAGINFARNVNEITGLAPGIDNTIFASTGLNTTIFKVGKPYGEFYGYKQAGIFQNQAEVDASTQPGARVGGMKYADTDGDKVFSVNDRTYLGSPLPDFTYGITLNGGYGNFDVLLFFYGSQGNKLYNVTKKFTDFQAFPSAASKRLLNAWTPQNPQSNIPMASPLSSALEYESSSYYVEDASYFRLKNIQIGYSLNDIAPLRKAGFTKLRVYVGATNLFTITGYSGLDPEVSQAPSTFSLPGIDLGVYPTPRQFLFGINTNF